MFKTVHPELKKAIISFLLDNETLWQRTNATKEQFKNYIYDPNGNYLIGGEAVASFICDAEKLLFN